MKVTKISLLVACTLPLMACVQPSAQSKIEQANVKVNINKIKSSQNPLFYGGNNIYPKGGQGLMDVKTGQFDPKTIELSAQLGLQSYRFPGGSEGNLYKWKRAIGPVEQRIDNVSGNNQGNQSNEFGSDEFGRLLETTSFTQGFIMVAYGYEKPDDAADWVEYMNSPVGANPNGGKDWAKVRADNGHPEPYNIRYWEIGNEVYGNWELNWGSYPHKGDAKRGTGNVEFDQATGKAGTLPFGSADRYIFGGYKYFEQQKAVSQSSWKDKDIITSGLAGQTYYVKFAPVELNDTAQPFELMINGQKWQRVASFNHSNETSLHYTLDSESGAIQFGDGKQGMIPAKDQFVYVNYLSGKQPGFIDYYQKMKAVDPSITILSCFEKESFYKLMAEAKQPYDGVVKHYYPSMPKNASPEEFYKASVYKGLRIERPIHEHIEWQHKYPNPSLTGNEKLWLTEYGLRAHMEQQVIMQTVINDYPDHVGTLLGHSLFLNNNTPMVMDNGIVRARALPIAIFAKHSLDNFVETQVDTPSYQYKKTKIPKLIATASTNTDKSAVNLVLTNTSPTESIQAQIDLSGFTPNKAKKAELWRLKSTTNKVIDDNSAKRPNNVKLEKISDLSFSQSINLTVEKAAVYVVKWTK